MPAMATRMDGAESNKLAQLPDEMFTIIKSAPQGLGPRLGRLALPGRKVLDTPHYLGVTSRGVVPHLTQDTFSNDTDISGVYVALEDFIERAPKEIPPLYKFTPPDGQSPLRRFIALPDDTLLVLGARRTPPIPSPAANPNTNTTIALCTAVGFKPLNADDYAVAVEDLKADIVVGLGDIPYGRSLGSKRVEKATDRSIQWLQDHVHLRNTRGTGSVTGKLFAPLLPVPCANQQFYIDCLTQDVHEHFSGLTFYKDGLTPLTDLPEELQHLPRLALTEPDTPQKILTHVHLGLDVLTVPFVTSATDAGIALDFCFQAPPSNQGHDSLAPRPLGLDMWATIHSTDLSPLVSGCKCYACSDHHRAYVQHLLLAKEMLGWVLLQIHNHHTMDQFFAGIRKSIANGTFDDDVIRFERTYESQLPEKTGQGPRVRGYQFKSEGPGEPKKNQAAYTMLDDGTEKAADGIVPSGDVDAEVLEEQGFAEKEDWE